MVSTPDATLALVTCAELPDGDEDGAEILAALDRQGLSGRWIAWDDASAPWGDFSLVVIRSPWDYTARREEFLAWTRTVPSLANDADVLAWNSDKSYLHELAESGIRIVPTTVIAEGDPIEPLRVESVVKPSVGAGSMGAGRFTPDQTDAASEHVRSLHRAGRTALVQPYLHDVDTSGETALVHFDGEFSHAIRKGAMLPSGTVHGVRSNSLFVEEQITSAGPAADELALGRQVVDFIAQRFDRHQLYARVDLLPSPDGPVVIEVELTEPSLFLSYSPGAADRFASAILTRVRNS